MDGHFLIKVAHMLYGVCPTIIHGKRGLSEPPGEFCSLNSAREKQLGDLIQRLAHNVVSHTFSRGALMPKFVEERLVGWDL